MFLNQVPKLFTCIGLCLGFIFFTHCKTPANLRYPEKEGWLGPKYYQLIVTGQAHKESVGYARRRAQSKADALKKAYGKLMGSFFDDKILPYCKKSRSRSLLCRRVRLLNGVIERGTIVKTSYDEADNCTITYQLFAKDLKSAVDSIRKSQGIGEDGKKDKEEPPSLEEKPPSLEETNSNN